MEKSGKPVTVLIISYSFPPCTKGAPTLMYNLCKYLSKKSFQVMTANSELATHAGDYDAKYVLDCSTIRLPVRAGKDLRAGLKFFFLSILTGLLLNKRGEFNCLLAVYPYEYDLYAAYVLRKITGKPLIIYMHDLFSEVRKDAWLYCIWKSIERRIFSSASAVIVTNERFRNYYLKRGVAKVIVLTSCIDLNEENQQATSQRLSLTRPGKKLRIVFTGLVYKANEDAILCFLNAAEKVKDVEVVFATTSKKDYLKDVSIGFLPKKACYDLQRNADVLFLPLSFNNSYPEEIECAFPTKALEYLAAGRPILAIVPKGTFSEEFVKKNEIGIVVTELSEQKIIDAIERLRDKETRKVFSENAFRAAPLYDARIQARRLYAIVQNVVSKSSMTKEHVAPASRKTPGTCFPHDAESLPRAAKEVC